MVLSVYITASLLVTQSQMACFREPETAIDTIRSWHVTFIMHFMCIAALAIKGCLTFTVIHSKLIPKNLDKIHVYIVQIFAYYFV